MAGIFEWPLSFESTLGRDKEGNRADRYHGPVRES
jgi:hypothetical protein